MWREGGRKKEVVGEWGAFPPVRGREEVFDRRAEWRLRGLTEGRG
jgi:hypothetical protein